MAGNQVDQRARNKERIDFARAAFEYGFASSFNARQAADTGADVDTDAVFVEGFQIVQA